MTRTLSLAQKFRMPRILQRAAFSMAFLSLSTGVFASTKTDSASLGGKLKASTALNVPDLDEWRAMDYSDAKVVTPKKVANGIVKPYKESKVQQVIDLVLNNTEYDEYFEEASLMTGIPAIYLKIKCAAESSLTPDAKSPTGPVGIAQFTRKTGLYAGLTINGSVDERRDARKAIIASANYTAYNLGRSDGHFFTTRSGGKTRYGAMAYYYGIVKSGDWKQYEANLKAVYDYFDLSHTLDPNSIIDVKSDWKAKKLRPENQEEFKLAMIAKKESIHDAQQPDVLPLELRNLPKFDTVLREQTVAAFVSVRDNIVTPNQYHQNMTIEKSLEDKEKAAQKERDALESISEKVQENKATFSGPSPDVEPDNNPVQQREVAQSFHINSALGARIAQAKAARPDHRQAMYAEFHVNYEGMNQSHKQMPKFTSSSFAGPLFQQYGA